MQVPETHPNEQIRGKDVEIEVALKDIKRLELAEINQAFLDDLGFQNEEELRDALREQMEERINYDVQQSMREQVNKYLLDNTQIDLPTKLSDRQAERDRQPPRGGPDDARHAARADRGQHRAAPQRRRRGGGARS